MGTSYFLGANSRDGFFSLYGEFCRNSGDFMHIIKGGPGTGKSSFMRKIARAAESKGLDVEYVLCSGDPDSLDGIYIPQMKTGWVDGTAPHVIEPKKFGIDSDYVNLGEFCTSPLLEVDKSYVNLIYELYREKYNAAYDCLKSSSLLRRRAIPPVFTDEHMKLFRWEIRDILKTKTSENTASALVKKRFYHAVCCKGELYLNDSVNLLCKQFYVFSGEFDGASAALRIAAEEAMKHYGEIILSYDPRDTEKLEAVIIPELSLAFVGNGWAVENETELLMDTVLPKEKVRELRPQLREMRRLEERIMGIACGFLAQAKDLHDELEEVYKMAMDFEALNEFTEDYIKAHI